MKGFIVITATQYVPVETDDLGALQLWMENEDNHARVLQEWEAGASAYSFDVEHARDDEDVYCRFADGKLETL